MKDAILQLVYAKRDNHSKYFSLSVTSRKNCSLCEITETLPDLEKRETFEKNRKIQEFYVRKKTSNRLKKFEKNRSFVEILENDENIQQKLVSTPKAKVRTIYYSDHQSSNFIPKTLKTFMKVTEPAAFYPKPQDAVLRPGSGGQEKSKKDPKKSKVLPSIKRSKHNNCISIQTDDHAI
jgi:hypothetical protein